MTDGDIRKLFCSFGTVEAVKCFRSKRGAYDGVGTSGCGLVRMAAPAEAQAAIARLHLKFAWTPTLGPMVRQRAPRWRRRGPHLSRDDSSKSHGAAQPSRSGPLVRRCTALIAPDPGCGLPFSGCATH
jgi:hypothetical protein